jgi:hypothetical protein
MSESIRERVQAARDIQRKRFSNNESADKWQRGYARGVDTAVLPVVR